MKSDTAPELVFVYGTLRRGGSNAFRMDGAEFVGPATVGGVLYRISWYPGLVLDGEGRVTGEVYRVGPELLRALDEFEGLAAGEIEGSEYRRVKVEALLGDEEELEVWVYGWKGSFNEDERIQSGDWLAADSRTGWPMFTILSLMPVWLLCALMLVLVTMRDFADRVPGWAWMVLMTGAPVTGLVAGLLGERLKEGSREARQVSLVVCVIWLAVIVGGLLPG
jgi:gamma-glutamylcyclotransferase (GGCT)/AIG2-like uncharacterized protein YtfP